MPTMTLAPLVEQVRAAGEQALARQRELGWADRERKDDGSVVTAVDREIEALLADAVAREFPGAGIVGEETARDWTPGRPLTFAIDPIDGTDSFSQGMAGWAISVGVLDEALRPVAGLVLAPTMGLELVADFDSPATLNGQGIARVHGVPATGAAANLMVSSRAHREVDLARFPGKIRNLGSAALHICCPFVFPAVVGALQGPLAHIWDLAGAHAVARSLGGDMVTLGGAPVDYWQLITGGPTGEPMLAGYPELVAELRSVLQARCSPRRYPE